MKSRKFRNSEKKKKSRILPEKSDLEKEVQEKVEIIPNKKEPSREESIEELDARGIISSGEFSQILKSEAKLNKLENIPVRGSLERGVIFAPRIREKPRDEGKVYSDTKYTKVYLENRYAEKTPGVYAEKEAAPEKESSNDAGGNGNK